MDRHDETTGPQATGAQDVATLISQLRRADVGPRISAAQRLSIFRDPTATQVNDVARAMGATERSWGGHPDPENRAAQILSLACRSHLRADTGIVIDPVRDELRGAVYIALIDCAYSVLIFERSLRWGSSRWPSEADQNRRPCR
jgi:hypothetical protein